MIFFYLKAQVGDPFKSHEIAPYLRLPVDFLHTVMLINIFRVTDTRHSVFAMRIGLECGFILNDDISQS